MAWTGLKKLLPSPHAQGSAGGGAAAQRGRWLLLALAGGLWGNGAVAATSYDLLVNHDAFRFGGTETAEVDAVDAPVGGVFVYRAKPKINGGSGTVSNATLTQRLPAAAIFQGIDAPSGVSCTGQPTVGTAIGSSVITCTIATLTTTELKVDFKVLIPDADTDHPAYAAIVAADNTDSNAGNDNGIQRNITTYKRADLAISFTGPAANATFQQGTVVNYQLQVSNTNNEYAFPLNIGEKAVVRFSQPPGTTFQSSPTSPGNVWSCTAGTDTSATPNVPMYTCTYTASALIAKNASLPLITIPVTVAVNSGDTTALASVAGQTTGGVSFVDAYTANNTTNVAIQFTPNNQLDMKLVKTVSPAVLDSQAVSPAEVIYTLKATRNSGLLIPDDITITDTLPANVSFTDVVSGTDANWSCSASGQVVTCAFNNVTAQKHNLPDLKFKAAVTVGSVTLTDGKAVIQNTAVLAVGNEPGGNSGNNTSSANLTVTNQIELETSKAASVGTGPIADGAEFSYTINVKNKSSISVLSTQTITVIDVLDGKLEYTGTDAPWACSAAPATWASGTPQTVTCTLTAGIAAGGSKNLKLNVEAHLDAGLWAQIANKASVSCPATRDCPGHTAGVILTNEHKINLSELQADLSIAKTAAITSGFSYGNGVSGSEVIYTLKVKNAVPAGQLPAAFQTAQTVVVTDTVTNLLNSNESADAHPVTGAPRYVNNRFIEASVDSTSLPSGMSVEACTYASSGASTVTVSCTLRDVPVGNGEYTITIKARQYVDPTNGADQTKKITNTASVSSPDTAEFDADNNTATANVTLTALTNLTAQKQASPSTDVLAGQKVEYTLNATNQGPSKATDVRVVDTLPEGMIWVTAPAMSGGSCTLGNSDPIVEGLVVTSANKEMTCTWTAAFNGGISDTTKSITYALRSANTGYPASVTNNAVVRTTTQETIAWDATPTDNTTSKEVTLAQPKLNVLITMGHSQDGLPIDNGAASQTQYTIRVTNSGESTSYANNVAMMDVFPVAGSTAIFENGTIDSVTLASGTNRFDVSNCQFTSAPESGLKCNFAWLAPGESVDIKFTMKAMGINNGTIPVGTILHEARVSADAEYLDGTTDVTKDNTVKDRTSAYDQTSDVDPADIKQIDLSVKKTVASPAVGDSVQVGGQIAYLLTVKNEETGAKHLTGGNAKVVDVLPEGLELVSAVPADCTYTAATRTLECTITDLNAGASKTFAFAVQVNSVALGQTAIANTATVSSLGDPVNENNESTVSVPVADLDVKLVKSVNVATPQPSQMLTYTLTVQNLGAEAATGVVVTDTLPAGISFNASASGCTAAGSTVTCNIANMAGNTQQALTFTANVSATATDGTALQNCAKVQAAGDKDASNNDSCATVTVKVPPPPSDPKGSISCSVFDDLDQNGSRDPGELGVAGVTIRLLNAQNQPVASTVTDVNGGYSFANLTPGTYTVVQETLAGYSPTTLVQRQVQVSANQNSAVCFGVTTKPQPGSIGCSVFDDANQNGIHDTDEKGLGGVTIRLFNDKDEEVASTTTAADGSYSFADLAPGTYKVSQVLPSGYSNTTPVERSTTVLSGKSASACFGALPGKAKPGSVGCSVFDDADKNGQRDPGEGGLAGITVRLLDASGKLLNTTTSATDGTYGFPDLAPGTYTVETDLPKGYSPIGSTSRQITVAEGADVSACFGAVGNPGALIVVKTLYEGWNAGAACGTSVAKKELLIVEKFATEHELTWCFAVTNQGNKHLGAPVWADSEYPGMVATAKAGTTLPLAPGATGTWYFQAKHKSSVVNVVGVQMPVTDPAGKLIPDVPPAKSSDDGKATFGMIYDPPYGVKVGTVDGADIINWTMVWVNDNVIAANNVYVSDTVKVPMEFVPGTLSCVGEGATSVVAGTCDYAAGTKTVSVRANFAPDLGKTVANAKNRLFISFKVKVPKTGGSTSYENQGAASWTPPGGTGPLGSVTVFVPGLKVNPIDPKDPKVPTVLPPPGVSVDDPLIGHPDPSNPGTSVETPVLIDPNSAPPEPPKPPPTVSSIPTLSEWGVILLSCLMGLLALRQVSFARRK